MSGKYKRYDPSQNSMLMLRLMLILACAIICVLLPLQAAKSAVVTSSSDDSELIVSRIKESLAHNGLLSIEQNTGKLLFNPAIDKLHNLAVKQKFLLPAMIVNQKEGLKLIGEIPFSCFTISGGELSGERYNGYRQQETLRYIRDVKEFHVSRALICQTVGSITTHWKKHLALDDLNEPFIFEEHVSLAGEHFYYFLNAHGHFEIYM